MTIAEILACIQAAEQLIPAIMSFANTIHPPTTPAPTKAQTVLTMVNNALMVSGVAAQTVQAMAPTLAAASHASVGATAPTATAAS